jgi:hypothetical protein
MDVAQFARLVTVVLTGTAAGAMVGHSVLLGRVLSWMFEPGRTEVFRAGFAGGKEIGSSDNLFG